jgi:hypothetical protein
MASNGDTSIPPNSGSEEDAKHGGQPPASQPGEPESPPIGPAPASQPGEPESPLAVKAPLALEEAPSASSNGKGEPPEALQPLKQIKIPLPEVYSDDKAVAPSPPPQPERSFSPQLSSYFAALVLTGSIVPLPFVALVFTAAIYILPSPSSFDKLSSTLSLLPNSGMDIIYGFVITIVLWLVISLPFGNAPARESMNAYSNNHINSHLLSLRALFRSVQAAQKTGNELQDANGATVQIAGTIIALRNDVTSYYDASAEKVRDCLKALEQELQKGKAEWLNGSGYLNAWTYIHRAEEAMVIIAPVEEVVKEALHDDEAIDGSALPTRDDTLNRLRLAVRKLSPAAGMYMKPPAVDPTAPGDGGNYPDPPDAKTAMNARIVIRDVKLTLNEFRDALWDGLVRIRNLLIASAHITGWLSFALLSAVLLMGATIPEIQAALIFYLVGSFTGMFGRLIIESQTDKAVDDYGLTVARIVVTPLIAGLAALAGVYLLAILSVNLLQSPAATGPTKIPTLDEIYSIAKNPQGLLSAAIFGLTPNLLISVVKQQADVVTTKLKNSSASNQGNN